MKKAFAIILVLTFGIQPALAPAQGLAAHHTLSFPQRLNQYVHIKLHMPVNGLPEVELAMPNWTPGSYLVRDYAANVEKLRASDAAGRFLDVQKVAKNRWRIRTEGIAELTVRYDVWAGELHVSSSWIESDFALLNGAGIYLYSTESRDWPQYVTLELPADWPRAFTSLEALDGENRYRAGNFDELVDSPIVAADAPDYPFKVDGQNYRLVNVGETSLWDGKKAAEDVAAIVKAQQAFWRVNPFNREYLFLNFLYESSGGLEHDHSTVMLTSQWSMRSRKDYIKWLGLVSHEFFHSWNVRRLRPEALSRYDYDKEVYTRELWLAEGLSSYFDNLLLFRSGLIDVADYFELLATDFRNYETVPGRDVRSAELSSFDSWIKQYVPDANSINSTVSYYRKGSVIGFVTDMAIRRETENQKSLDDVMREMYLRYGPDGSEKLGYPPGSFEKVVESLAGPKLKQMLETLLKTTMDPDLDAALKWYGLRLNRAPGNSATDESNDSVAPGLGVTWQKEPPLLLVEHVIRGGPAANAGVLPGDELLAINGSRVTRDNFDDRISRLRVAEQTELTLVRNQRLLTVSVQVKEAIPENYAITPKPNIGKREKIRLEKWLGRELMFSNP